MYERTGLGNQTKHAMHDTIPDRASARSERFAPSAGSARATSWGEVRKGGEAPLRG